LAKVLVDLDPEELDRAKRILGTTKNTEAIRLAIREVIALRARQELVEMFQRGAFADLGDPEVRRAAWS
jgi:hypothetical protein